MYRSQVDDMNKCWPRAIRYASLEPTYVLPLRISDSLESVKVTMHRNFSSIYAFPIINTKLCISKEKGKSCMVGDFKEVLLRIGESLSSSRHDIH
jgi:hypothetical protein